MKKFVLLLMVALMASCSGGNNDPSSQSADGSISYKVNGQLVSMDNVNISNREGAAFVKQLKGSRTPATRYLLNAQKGFGNLMVSVITTDSLHAQNYHYDSAFANDQLTLFVETFNGQQSQVFYSSDYFDFVISSYSNGRISGTFTAKMTPASRTTLDYNNRGSVVITEGKINNVPVSYQNAR